MSFIGKFSPGEDESDHLSIGANMIAASGAGAATTIFTNTLWTQGMRAGVVPYRSTLSAFVGLVLYSQGTSRDGRKLVICTVDTDFKSYACIGWYQSIMLPFDFQHMRRSKFTWPPGVTTMDKLGACDVAVASSVSRIFASTLTYPHEVIRSRLQEQGFHSEKRYSGVVDCINKVFQQEGLPGFYRGCATNLIRTTPAAVVTFTSSEMIHNLI